MINSNPLLVSLSRTGIQVREIIVIIAFDDDLVVTQIHVLIVVVVSSGHRLFLLLSTDRSVFCSVGLTLFP